MLEYRYERLSHDQPIVFSRPFDEFARHVLQNAEQCAQGSAVSNSLVQAAVRLREVKRAGVSATAPKLVSCGVSSRTGRLRVLKATWKTEFKGHVIELENRPNLERLIVDGKEVAKEPGATWEPRSFQATIPDGNRSMKVEANTRFSKRPRGIRFTVSVDGNEIYSEVKWPLRWYFPFAAAGMFLACVALRLLS